MPRIVVCFLPELFEPMNILIYKQIYSELNPCHAPQAIEKIQKEKKRGNTGKKRTNTRKKIFLHTEQQESAWYDYYTEKKAAGHTRVSYFCLERNTIFKKIQGKKGDFTCRYPQAIENNTEKEREVMGTLLYTGKKAAGRTIV